MIPVVGFEMGRLEISLSTLGVVAHERPLPVVLGWKLPEPSLCDATAADLGGGIDSPERRRRPPDSLRRGLQNEDGRHEDWGLGVGADDGGGGRGGGRDGRGRRRLPKYLLVDWGIIAKDRRGCWLHNDLWWHYHSGVSAAGRRRRMKQHGGLAGRPSRAGRRG